MIHDFNLPASQNQRNSRSRMITLATLFVLVLISQMACPLQVDAAETITASKATTASKEQPNVILIMADDIGHQCYGCYGSKQYSTPNIDALAAGGMKFNHCYSQPVCTPSRAKIMTGKSNVRNYVAFSILDAQQITFGHLFKKAGYTTAIAGKWQLYGMVDASKRMASLAGKGMHPSKAGFDEYRMWQIDSIGKGRGGKNDSRYWAPFLDTNGVQKQYGEKEYGPKLFTDFICDFIDKNKKKPFFVYYPMVLPHNPSLPTPDSKNKNSTVIQKNYEDMVAYMDKNVGRIVKKLEALNLRKKTLILVTGDNGCPRTITSRLGNRIIIGGKSKPTKAGMNVALIASMPGTVPAGKVNDDLVDFSDILPTMIDWIGQTVPKSLKIDGHSFAPQLRGQKGTPQPFRFCYYAPGGASYNGKRARFAYDKQWKLYDNGRLFNLIDDIREKKPIDIKQETPASAAARKKLQAPLDAMPKDSPLQFLTDAEKRKRDAKLKKSKEKTKP